MRPDTEAIRKRVEAATPGNWQFEIPSGEDGPIFCYAGEDPDCEITIIGNREADVTLLMDAKDDLTALLDYVAELEAKTKTLHGYSSPEEL